jgi:hypothetical protein
MAETTIQLREIEPKDDDRMHSNSNPKEPVICRGA